MDFGVVRKGVPGLAVVMLVAPDCVVPNDVYWIRESGRLQ